MADFILHHYSMSPFSEKIRVMLGYAQVNWLSCVTREMPPRPLLARLAGGYRKIPVAQMGADIFCDSKIIAAEIAQLSQKPLLAVENLDAEQQAYISKVDLDLFFASLFVSGTMTLNIKVLKAMSLLDIGRFLVDRINVGRKARVKAVSPLKAKAVIKQHIADLEQRLSQEFLFGAQPTHADFSTYHSLWFIHDLAEAPFLQGHPKLLAWMARMKNFGHGLSRDVNEAHALLAAKAEPRTIPETYRQDLLIGHTVTITPADYGCEPTMGVLVGANTERYIVARQDTELGTLHVHFPRQGYTLKAIS
ncbi:glutathione S-transferase family protein [Agitococcus lubricus]|uniref:Glutathione S-transferase n=1 Tax=Agitococcus lubricus TaxID=1077255 RepID=A0A2T5IZM3_9GAMM|nr:glutathione S-transferase family protein [Agitococcus lubricus]PTQ89530.1 glutathione S-transferase [Agitococcus lubricus]